MTADLASSAIFDTATVTGERLEPVAFPPTTVGVIIRCTTDALNGDSVFAAISLEEDDHIFQRDSTPVSAAIGVPLVTKRIPVPEGKGHVDLTNRIATFLNIDLACGLAPPLGQRDVGTVVVARRDKKPLLPHHVEAIWMYCEHIFSEFEARDGVPPSHLYSRTMFVKFWGEYSVHQEFNRLSTEGAGPDDWADAPSPLEM